ncbi:uncharacterized protein F5Z01DRAFT_687397 [Emericellopsis atlantica]|uniref:Uncharacterized protein n=1 Tax=Emericellopsis atlantica TaxID=2614577 RepID=A0A9P7ZLM4_9HYPO|nr:uncharacterized protein F5Z01DRAFT_687397 [Emericellopsis atlantica]KAG9253972.1 hypothetical protein F5Z01DRAFT_687397 [Emericellopsis atlantica]
MGLRKRIAVSIALGLSTLVFIVFIYKLAIFDQLFEQLALDPTCEFTGFINPPWASLRDPVPYLDILGVDEGCILIICASLPTLGRQARATKGKLSSTVGGSSRLVPGESGHAGSNWSKPKGHKLGNDDAEGVSNMHSSVGHSPGSSVDSAQDPTRNSQNNGVYPTDRRRTYQNNYINAVGVRRCLPSFRMYIFATQVIYLFPQVCVAITCI